MNPASLIPRADALPVHWFWLQLPLSLTVFLHLVAMNVVVGGTAVALFTLLREGAAGRPFARVITRPLPVAFALAVNFGVAPLLFLQALYGQFFYTSTVLMAVFWESIVVLLILAYYGLYLFDPESDSPLRAELCLAAVVTALLLVAFFFVNDLSLMQNPSSWARYFANRQGTIIHHQDPALLPRYLHITVSALAVGGLAIAMYLKCLRDRGQAVEEAWIRKGCNWFTAATLVNYPLGFLFLDSLPAASRDPQTPAGLAFAVLVILSALGGALAMMSAQTGKVYAAGGWTLATVFLMSLSRDFLRLGALKPYFSLPGQPETPQYAPLLIFVVVAAGGGWVVLWMLRKIAAGKEVAR